MSPNYFNECERWTVFGWNYPTIGGEVQGRINDTKVNATSEDIPNSIVRRDANGDFIAHIVNAENINASTGLLIGGKLTVNALDNTKFDISGGTGLVTKDYVYEGTISESIHVEWSDMIGVESLYVYTDLISFISIDENANVIQQPTRPTQSELRDRIYLGVLVHVNRINLDTTNPQPLVITHTNNQLYDLYNALGFLNLEGNEIVSSGANLQIKKLIGKMLAFGSNFYNDTKNPHVLTLQAKDPQPFQIRTSDGTNRSVLEIYDIDPDNYEPTPGTYSNVSNNKFTIQRFFLFTSGNVKVQPGQAQYSSMQLAIDAIFTEAFTVEPSIQSNGVWIAVLIVKKGCTDLSNTAEAVFEEIGKFAGIKGSSSNNSTTLQSSYDNSVSNPKILTNSTLNEFSIRQGSGLDSDVQFSIQNGAGVNTFTIDGSGNLEANNVTENNVANTIVKRNINGDFIAGRIYSDLTGDVTGNLTGDVTGNLTGNVTGNLTGDVTGNVTGSSYSSTFAVNADRVVDDVGNKTVTQVENTVDDVLNATHLGSFNTLVRRGAAGEANFGDITCGDFTSSNIIDSGNTITINANMYFSDNEIISLGTGQDMSIYHGGTNSNILNFTGDLIITNFDALNQIYFKVGTTTTATSFIFRDSANNPLFRIYGDGSITANGTISASFSGNLNGTASNFSGSLSGDVTGTQSSTTVASVGGKTASQIATSVDDTEDATSSNIANRIVRRDASGQINISDMYSNDLYPNVTESYDLGDVTRLWRNLYVKNNLTEVTLGTNSVITNNSNGGVSSPGIKLANTGTIELYDTTAPAILFHQNETGNSARIAVADIGGSKTLFFYAGTDNIYDTLSISDSAIECNQALIMENDHNIKPQYPNSNSQLGETGYEFKKLYTSSIIDDGVKVTLSNEVLIENDTSHLNIYQNAASGNDIRIRLSGTNDGSRLIIRDSLDENQAYFTGDGKFVSQNIIPMADANTTPYDIGAGSRRYEDIYATNGTIQTSDRNEKSDIEDSDLGLDFINNLRPKKYKWKGRERMHYGLIAQDVQETLDGRDFAGFIDSKYKEPDEDQRFGLRYQEFIGPMIKAIQQQQQMIIDLQAEIVQLKEVIGT